MPGDLRNCRGPTWNVHCGEAAPCGQQYFFTKAYCDDHPIVQTEEPLAVDIRPALGELIAVPISDLRYGKRLRTWTANLTDWQSLKPRTSAGDLFPDNNSRYGRQLMSVNDVGCFHTGGLVRDNLLFDTCMDPITRAVSYGPCWAMIGAAYPFLMGDAYEDRYGPQLRFAGQSHCQATIPDGSVYREQPFHTDMFGQTCWYCPWMLWTTVTPCLGCSFDYHNYLQAPGALCPGVFGGPPSDPHDEDNCYFDWVCEESEPSDNPECEALFPNIPGQGQYYNPNWHFGCHGDNNGVPTIHHCTECMWKQLIGRTVNSILQYTQATRRIPLLPDTSTTPGASCGYGCGAFGWRMPHRLRLDGLGVDQDDTIATDKCLDYFRVCPLQDLACAGFFHTRWGPPGNIGEISSASVCFREHELCDPQLEPCDNHPCHDCPDGDYHKPSATVIVWCDARIVLKINVETGDSYTYPECCESLGLPIQWRPETITVVGQFHGPVPWGDRMSWPGYGLNDIGDGVDFGWQSGPCALDPMTTFSFPRTGCANLFVNHGRVTDFGGPTSNPYFYNGPKQCPTNISRDFANDSWFCLPKLKWTWSRGNKEENMPQCMDVEPIRNAHGACVDGTDSPGFSGLYECSKVECRRGCAPGEQDRDLDEFCDRRQPYDDPYPFHCSAHPWSCGQCLD